MKKNLKKYSEIMKMGFKSSLQYRAEMLLWLVIDLMPILSMIVLWVAVYSKQGSIAGYSLDDMLSYYVVGYFANSLISVHFEEYWVDQIRKGEMSFILLKPFSFKLFAFIGEIAWKIMSIFLVTLPLIVIVGIFSDILFVPTLQQGIYVGLAILLGFTIDSILSFFVIAGGFVFEQANSLSHLKWMLSWVLSGSMLPYELMPSWLASIARLSPFQFLYTVPVKIYTDFSTQNIISLFSSGLLWILGLLVTMQVVWRVTVKKYTAVGN